MNNHSYSLKKVFFWFLWWGAILAISSYFLFNALNTHWPKITAELYAPRILSPDIPVATPAANPNVASLSAATINDLVHAIMTANKQQASEGASESASPKAEVPKENTKRKTVPVASQSAGTQQKNL